MSKKRKAILWPKSVKVLTEGISFKPRNNMTVKELKYYLEDIPDDYIIEVHQDSSGNLVSEIHVSQSEKRIHLLGE